MKQPLEGVLVPLVTPLQDDDKICERGLEKLIASVRQHATALVPGLSSGEGWKLTDAAWTNLLQAVLRHAGNLPLYPGAMAAQTADLWRRARIAADIGVAGLTIPVPSLAGAHPQEAASRFADVITRLNMPVILYFEQSPPHSIPAIDALIGLCNLDDVVAIKESSRSRTVAKRLVEAQVKAAVFQGWEDQCLDPVSGVAGYALALANLEPALCHEMWRAPSAEVGQAIFAAAKRYCLFDDDWYVAIKTELVRRGILATALPLPDRPMLDYVQER